MDIGSKNKKKKIRGFVLACILSIGAFAVFYMLNVSGAVTLMRHVSDTFNMITENGSTNQTVNRKDENSSFTDVVSSSIKSNYAGDMLCIGYNDSSINGTGNMDSTVYGPYIWLPSGSYTVSITLTDYGWEHFLKWDVCTDRGSSISTRIDKGTTGTIWLSDDLKYAENISYSGHTLTYTYDANGHNADYEWRLYFNCLYQDVSQAGSLVSNVSVKRVENNTVSFDTQGGTLNNVTSGTLATTNWGSTRAASVSVPTRDGYTFTGWYAYNAGSNSKANGTKVDFSGNLVQIWDANGNLCSNATTETSYVNYIVYAGWEANEYTVNYNTDGGTATRDGQTITSDTLLYDQIVALPSISQSFKLTYKVNDTTANPATIDKTEETVSSTFNGWKERLSSSMDRGILNGSGAYMTGTWNWAAYINGNSDVSASLGYAYNFMGAITHYRNYGLSEGRQFSGSTLMTAGIGIKNLTTVDNAVINLEANYTYKTVTLPTPTRTGYTFKNWTDSSGKTYDGGATYTVKSSETFTAQWESTGSTAITYTLTYDGNSGTPSRASDTAANNSAWSTGSASSYSGNLATASYTGYTFTGWYTEKIDGTQITASTVCTGDLTVYAHWSLNSYTITVNHYVMDTSGNYPTTATNTSTIDAYYGMILTNSGYVDSGLIVNNGITYNASKSGTTTTVTSDTTINLYYERQKHNVNFNVVENGGTWSNGETTNKVISIYYDATIPINDHVGMKNKFNFIGWNQNINATSGVTPFKMGTSDITLYGIYGRTITTTFVDYSGSKDVSITIYNKATGGTIDVPTITAYTGWGNVSDAKSIGFNSHKNIKDSGATTSEVDAGTKSLVVTDNKTYYAVYSAQVSLTYVLNGGEESSSTASVTRTIYRNAADFTSYYNSDVTLGESKKTSYDESGYIHSFLFATWAENSEDGTQYPANTAYQLTQNTVMYAIWNESMESITYTIQFDGNNGIAVQDIPEQITVQYNQSVTLPTQEPTRTAFTFLGWNTKADGTGTEFQPGDSVMNLTSVNDGVVTLYAQWKQKKFLLVKAASTIYHDTIVKRTDGDDDWYNSTGYMTIDQLTQIRNEDCVQVWNIDKQGTITRVF